MKPKRIKKYQNLSPDLKKMFDQKYDDGFDGMLTSYTDPRDNQVYKAVPLETDEFYYLVNIEDLIRGSAIGELDDDSYGDSEAGEMSEAVNMDGEEVEGMSDDDMGSDEEDEPADEEYEEGDDDDE